MEIVFAVIGVILIGYLFWQSYLLAQYSKIIDNQKQVMSALSMSNDELRAENESLKPF